MMVKHMESTSTFILLLKTCPHMLFQSVLQPVPVNNLFWEKQKLGRLKTTSLIVKFIAQSSPQPTSLNKE